MSISSNPEQPQESQNPPRRISWIMVVRVVFSFFFMPLVLFIAAWRLDWWMAWVYIGILYAGSILSRVLMARLNPGLATESAQGAEGAGVKAWDKVLVPLVAIWGPFVRSLVRNRA